MANKMALLDREVKYLINKAKIWKPKQEPVVNATENAAGNKTKDSNDSSSESLPESDKNKTEETKPIPDSETESNESKDEKLVLESSDTTEEKNADNEEDLHQEL